ncbi:hypothetical protein ARMSODRAFT_346061 [Armillaria solidipes]|uniref:Uncharacterized protein n=1 Tax=Armillaria solidipes TaxID=1076256 RepID=A0A2H3BLA4_9AGAR|nr:hypothetical protein ARMSODRAFT_346061 [Armillaria solidipes]
MNDFPIQRRHSSETELLFLSILVLIIFHRHCILTRAGDAKGYLKNGVFPKMKQIQDDIVSLKKEEEKLAREYGMEGNLDSVNILQEAKGRAFAARRNLNILNRLHDCRQELHTRKIKIPDDVGHLEKDEERLAKEYGMVGDIDPVKVVEEARRRVEASKASLFQLDRLHERRLELAKYRRSIGNTSAKRI